MKILIQTGVLICFVAGAVATVVIGSQRIFTPGPLTVQGEVDARQVDVAPKIPGRLESVQVREGDSVTAGQVVATMKSPEIEAKLAQATGAQEAASAQREKAQTGARKQEIEAAMHAWQTANASADLARKSYERVAQLYESEHVAQQTLDEAMAKWKAATQMAQAAKAMYDMALDGAREEDKKAAAAIEKQAGGAVSEVQSYLAETEIKSPIQGEVVDIIADPGELVTAGFPVVSVVDLNDIWVVFNLREDLLADVRMGSVIPARFPGLGGLQVDLTVDYIKALGDYATWRATRTSGDFDMKTFEVHARPSTPVEGLRPGMTVVVEWETVRAAHVGSSQVAGS